MSMIDDARAMLPAREAEIARWRSRLEEAEAKAAPLAGTMGASFATLGLEKLRMRLRKAEEDKRQLEATIAGMELAAEIEDEIGAPEDEPA